jgi:glycosyltransferase involved in cell wall biosynthesis
MCFETLGLVALEAGAAAKPVVASRAGGLPEAVLDTHSGFIVEPGDAEAFAGRCIQLCKNAELRMHMGEAGLKRVRGVFSLDREVLELLTWYRQ